MLGDGKQHEFNANERQIHRKGIIHYIFVLHLRYSGVFLCNHVNFTPNAAMKNDGIWAK